ncbi:poly(3-hydroxybutyrate) depolymerase [Megasphaera elsdenii]|uniref:portal protein n=1 Tax=Megasphaera elsdenii TaxID=907 RepID=UPI00195606C6|nr:hypothetical protein [Megasphaera elsdenii]MBM6701082.1 poly(3-hydroxybutyrate) depolymerase [Megasphaera elsdenii]
MSFIQNKENPTLDDIDKSLVTALQRDISDAENYQDTVILPTVKERYEIYYADKDYYARKLPRLSKVSSLVSTDVTDTIEWALPSLIKVFTGGDEVVTVQGSSEEDDRNAEIMQQLLVYQLQRQNRFFPILYNWMKDALITGMGIIKCYWDRKEDYQLLEQSMNMRAFQELTQQNVEIQSVEGPDMFGIVRVQYLSPYYVKNAPVIENILVSELLYSSDAKSLDEANFVAHKKKVTMSYLREREQQGIYANVDQITPKPKTGIMNDDQVEQVIGDNYQGSSQEADDARAEVTLYECYTKLDWNNDGVLEDMIITIVDDVVLRVEPNYMGRHPFFAISPTKDPHRIWVKRSYAELIGELQDLKVALTRQIVQNIALTNDPKMILAEDAINIDDYVKGRAVIRKKANHPMQDVAMSMPVNQLSPYTYQFLEYIESQKENRTGITRYNQGLDANTLNKTATGISQIMGASTQRLELIARMFAETGVYELFRFMIGLNQKFIDQNTVIRLTNKELAISPDDLQGNFDLIVNAGISIASKESTQLMLQSMLTALMQVRGAGIPIVTPDNVYNLFKKWIEAAGFKNYADYITDPAVVQQRMATEYQLKMQVLSSLPPQAAQLYMQTGVLPPGILMSLPPEIQALFDSGSATRTMWGGVGTGQNGIGVQETVSAGYGQGGPSAAGGNPSSGMVGGLSRTDNRQPQNVPRERGNGPPKQAGGVGGF